MTDPKRLRHWAIVTGLVMLVGPLAAQQLEEEAHRADEALVEQAVFDEEEPKEKRLDTRVSLGFEADDNILHLRDDTLAEFESGDFDPDRFLVGSADDTILVPSLETKFSLVPTDRRTLSVRLRADAVRYSDNSIKDFERFRIEFDKVTSDTRPDLRALELEREAMQPRRFKARRSFLVANRSRFRLQYSVTPERYQGQLTDDDGGGRQSSVVDSEMWRLSYVQRLGRGGRTRSSAWANVGLGQVDYNAAFDERDYDVDEYGLGLYVYRLFSASYLRLGLGYLYSQRNANTALIGAVGPAGVIEDDISREADAVSLYSALYWYREKDGRPLRQRGSFRVRLTQSDKRYTTTSVDDLSHFGREDEFGRVLLSLTLPLSDSATLTFFAEDSSQSTSLEPLAEFDRLDPSSYSGTVFGVSWSYYTRWRSRT